jgi:hypothetical protein
MLKDKYPQIVICDFITLLRIIVQPTSTEDIDETKMKGNTIFKYAA